MDFGMLATGCGYLVFSFVLFVAVFNQGVYHWDLVRPVFRRGLWVGGTLAVLSIPSLLSVFQADMGALFPAHAAAGSEFGKEVARITMFAFSLAGVALSLFYTPLQMGVATLIRATPAFPLLMRAEKRTVGLLVAVAVGFLGAIGSLVSLKYSQAAVSQSMNTVVQQVFGVKSTGDLAGIMALVAMFLSAAIGEEIVFRGLLQGWLARWLGASVIGTAIAILVPNAIWALLHAPNTTSPLWKVTQIFLFGLALGELARRYSVEASICAHATMSLSMIVLVLVF